jgi:arsenate reductase-like glutaredoxin family protein
MEEITYRIYYTKRCKECLNLLNVIINERIQRMFIPISIDEFSEDELIKLSSQLNVFPTIIISSQTKSTAFQGPRECSQWLNSFLQNRRMSIMQRVSQQRKLMARKHYLNKMKNDSVMEYNEEEMSGVSDSYTFNTSIDLAHDKNFVPVGQEDNFNIVTPQNRFNKLNYKDIRNKISDMEKERKVSENDISSFLEKEQIRTILNKSSYQ